MTTAAQRSASQGIDRLRVIAGKRRNRHPHVAPWMAFTLVVVVALFGVETPERHAPEIPRARHARPPGGCKKSRAAIEKTSHRRGEGASQRGEALLQVEVDAGKDETGLDGLDQGGADGGAPGGADTAEQAGTSEDGGGDHVELAALAKRHVETSDL